MTLSEAIGKRVQALLEERGMKQYDLFREGGIPRATISCVVRAKKGTLKMDTVYQLASTFGITLAEFFDDPIFQEVTD